MTYAPGDILLEKYRIEALLGQGAFGEVYRVTHTRLMVTRAVKVLRRDAPGLGSRDYAEIQERFLLESRLGARLNNPLPNPHLLQVFDCHVSEEVCLLEMDYAAGGSLAERLQIARQAGQPMQVKEAVQIAAEVAGGLAALHRHDIIHRDLKPSNILFDEKGHARLSDLGLAQAPGGPSLRSQFSEPRPHPGTPGYMSPEQENSGKTLKPPSDIYCLGLVLFEMLTGRNYTFLEPGTHAKSLRAEIPPALDELLGKLLAENPRERPWDGEKTASLLNELLKSPALSGQPAARPPEKVEPPVERSARLKVTEAETRLRKQAEEERQRERWQAEAEQLRKDRQAAELQQAKAAALRQAEARRAAEALKQNGSIELAPGLTLDFVRIPAGEFLMGSDPSKDRSAAAYEQPQHKIFLAEYWLGKYPVTNRQFEIFVKATGYKTRAEISGKSKKMDLKSQKWVDVRGMDWRHPGGPASNLEGKASHPVVNVSLEDAAAFCAWAGKLSAKPVRLPSEAEWEKGARGTDGRMYPWGDAAPDAQHCNFNLNLKDTTPVGKYSPKGDSPFGCADMAGNVWEWVSDWYDENYYRKSPANNPAGPPSGTYRVMRGGSWYFIASSQRCAGRGYGIPATGFDCFGFRCVLGLLP